MLHLLVLSALIATTTGVLAAPEVIVGKTTIIGAANVVSSVEFFGGIPFAKPPVGELRLKRPELITALDVDILNAQNFGLSCQQTSLPPTMVSEDCLTLNIFRPAGVQADAKLPVMVWIYGGAFVMGTSAFFNGTGIVAHSVARGTPMIFASLNYRVGPLGFPQGAEAAERNILNLGLYDQLAGMEWIQANIANFGGDKNKVTIFGESAGATSISVLLLNAKIKTLARAAILESTATAPTYGPERSEAGWQQYVAAVPSCVSSVNTTGTIDCMRKADSASLLRALTLGGVGFTNGVTVFQPVIDGPGGLLPDRPSKVVPQGNLPSIIGSNLDEGTLFTAQDVNSTDTIRRYLAAWTSPIVAGTVSPAQQAITIEGILALYPNIAALGSPFGTGNETFGLDSQYKRFAAIFGDILFQSPRRTLTQDMSKAGVKIFGYYFTDPDAQIPSVGFPGAPPAAGSIGIGHAAELSYLFGGLTRSTPTAVALSGVMRDYWISFATSLDPNDLNGTPRPRWLEYTPNTQVIMELNGHNTRSVPDAFRALQIAFLQKNADALHR
ncbi:extracellular triacylglycerol lipase precursor [Crassisporium funariophilum]|nr:extracellular triacylglycerol lipase precursor [Crassisporium funariophilum]